MPKLLSVLSLVGTAAMLWVGGHILLVGADELGWHWPYDIVHEVEHSVEDVPGIGGVLAWIINTALSAAVGLAVGTIVVAAISRVERIEAKSPRELMNTAAARMPGAELKWPTPTATILISPGR